MADLDGRMFTRQGDHFVPSDYGALEMVQGVAEGKEILLYHRTPRSPKNHAHYRAILAKAVEHLETFNDVDDLHDAIKIASGHTRPVMKTDGEVIFIPKTSNFASMGEEEFKRFKNRALYVLSQLLGFDALQLLPEIDAQNRRNR